MNRKPLLAVATAAVLALSTFSPASGESLWAISGAGQTASVLYVLDPGTGAVLQTIGNAGTTPPQHIASLAFHPVSGALYAYVNNYVVFNEGQLATLNTTTGAATPLPQSSLVQVPDMTFSSTGTLYGWTEGGTWTDELVTFDISTGAAALVGTTGAATSQTGLAFDTGGILYMKSGRSLETVNPITALSTPLITVSQNLDNALAFSATNECYSILRSGGTSFLMKIDIPTGNVTTVGDIGVTNISAITFQRDGQPTPAATQTWGKLKHLYR